MSAGKGDKPRPVNLAKYTANYEAIFRKNKQPRKMDLYEPDDNWAGDNLAPTEDDEPLDHDEAENWVNNPIRKLFDNPKSSFHRSHLYEHATEEDENDD